MRFRIKRYKHTPDFIIETLDSHLVHSLTALYGSDIHEDDSSEEGIHFYVRKEQVIVDGLHTIYTEDPLQTIENIIFEKTQITSECIGLHAAAIAYLDRAYIFCASTGVGKTTLTAFLTSQGFEYLTDDCVLIEKDSHRLLPYPKPMYIRGGSMKVLAQLGINLTVTPFIDSGKIPRYAYQPHSPVKVSYPIERIFFLQRTGSQNSLSSLVGQDALVQLLRSFITVQQPDTKTIQALTVLSKHCGELCYSDMEYVSKIIRGDI